MLVIANQGEKVSVSCKAGQCSAWSIPCARCLEPVKVPFDLEIDLELDMKKTERGATGRAGRTASILTATIWMWTGWSAVN